MTSGTNAKEILQMVKQGPPNPRDIKPIVRNESKPLNEYNERVVSIAKQSVAEISEAELKEQAAKKEEKPVEVEEENNYIFDDYGNKIRNIHASRARRKKIEARCASMDIGELLMLGYVEQKVVLRPGKLEVVFRSISSSDAMYIFNQLEKEKGPSLLMAYKIGRLNLTFSLMSINGEKFESVKNGNKINEDAFKAKYEKICSFPEDLAVDLITNYNWFTERVKELSVDDESIINF